MPPPEIVGSRAAAAWSARARASRTRTWALAMVGLADPASRRAVGRSMGRVAQNRASTAGAVDRGPPGPSLAAGGPSLRSDLDEMSFGAVPPFGSDGRGSLPVFGEDAPGPG